QPSPEWEDPPPYAARQLAPEPSASGEVLFGPDNPPTGLWAAQEYGAEERAPVATAHVPDTWHIGHILLPDEIRMSVAIQVRGGNDSPAGLWNGNAQEFSADDRAAIGTAHVPNTRHIGPILLPDEIRMSVAIQVRGGNDSPARLWNGNAQEVTAEDRAAIGTAHVPNTRHIAPILLPNKIRMSVAIQVAGGNDSPARLWNGNAQEFGAEDRTAIGTPHVPDTGHIGHILLPDEIRMSVAIQVAGGNDSPAGLCNANTQKFGAEDRAAAGTPQVPDTGHIRPILLPDDIGVRQWLGSGPG